MQKVITAQGISKVYQIGAAKQGSLSESLSTTAKRIFSGSKIEQEEFWALRNVDFHLEQGQVLGIVGRNGAGKSTLLKVLSRITLPSSGRIEINGRVSSLLEVGTGFHPELTGRENIFLNGTILGMKRKEIKAKFDEIVAFSDIEKFIDTPVKRYSSGMYVRLAFAVAAHLEPEILIIDEVLAVGDLAFQKKCLGKMHDVAKGGRTVLFVSHNMQAVRSLCNVGLFLQNGLVKSFGDLPQVLDAYDKSLSDFKFDEWADLGNEQTRRGLGHVRFTKLELHDEAGNDLNAFEIGQILKVKCAFNVKEDLNEVHFALSLRSGISREFVTSVRHRVPGVSFKAGDMVIFDIQIDTANLRPGEYPIYFWLGDTFNTAYDVVDDLLPPLVISTRSDAQELGYDPSVHSGYFSLLSTLKEI